MKTEYFLGIDMGTTSVKVGIFDAQGTIVASADAGYPLYTPKSGWAEQKPEEWWAAVCNASREMIEQSGVEPGHIVGMGVDTTCCTVLFADEEMNILRPAIMWMDMRASKQAKKITATGHPMLKYNGYGNVSAESMPAKALWVKENEPEIYARAKYVFECNDWLMYKLTGRLVTSINITAPRWYYDRPNGGWPVSFYESFGLGDVLEKFPKEVLDLGTLVGGLLPEAAKEMGLVADIPVGEGGADAYVGMIGLNVVGPESVALITGSSHLLLGLTEQEMHATGMWGSYQDAVIPGLGLVEAGQTSTGSIVNWFKTNFCAHMEAAAKGQGKSVYDLLNAGAEALPIGAEGLLALDYFQGNRAPYADPDVRGMFYGLSLVHTPIHLYRAIIESICHGTEALMESFRGGGMNPSGIYVAGGAVKSKFWMQTHADVCNLPIYIPKVTEAPCLGSAILGAVACGYYSDIVTGAKHMVSIADQIEPNFERHQEHMFYFEKYKQAYQDSKEWMHDVTMHSLS